MFDIRHQEQRIKELRAQLKAEREVAAERIRAVVPQTRRALLAGSAVWGARKALPLLEPLAVVLLGGGKGKGFGKRLIKVGLLSALAFGALRLLGVGRRDSE